MAPICRARRRSASWSSASCARARPAAPAAVLARLRSRSTTRLFELPPHEPRLMPHLHLSLQAGDDMILKRMKRRHSRADAIAMVERLKRRRGPASRSAPTSSPASRPRPRRCSRNTLALIDECGIIHGPRLSLFARGPARPPRGCRRSRRRVLKARPRGCARPAPAARRPGWPGWSARASASWSSATATRPCREFRARARRRAAHAPSGSRSASRHRDGVIGGN